MRVLNDWLERERKKMIEVPEREGNLYRRKKALTNSLGGDTPRKT